MRFLSPLLAIAIVFGLSWWFVLRHEPVPMAAGAVKLAQSEAVEPAEPPVPVMVLEITAEETEEQKILRGRTEANRAVEIRAETEGLVVSEPLRAGARVSRGDLVCEIEPGNRSAQLAEARAALAEARVEAEAARSLSEKGFTAETTRIAREARLEAAQAELDLVELDLERLTMESPFNGVLETDTAEIGSRLGVGDLCATVIDLSRIRVTAYISEQDVDRVSPGDPVLVTLINGRTHAGEIRFIGRMADEDTRTYKVEAVLDNNDGQIRDGMTAEITVSLPSERAHLIPQLALTLDDEGRLGVRLAENGIAQFYPIRVLRDEKRGAWVAGLPPTATLIVVGQEFVRDGRSIEAVPVKPGDLG